MGNLKYAILGASLVLFATGTAAQADRQQRHVGGEFFIEGESCGEMKWYWPDKNVPGSGFSWEVTGCDALAELMGSVPPSTPEPPPQATPTPVIDPGDCPAGAQWLNQPNSLGGLGFDSVHFQPDETKYYCIRLAENDGPAWKLKFAASGWSNAAACESLTLKLESLPSNSTADPRLFEDTSRSPGLRIASHNSFANQLKMDAPPGLYIVSATEAKGPRAPGEEVCRHFRIGVHLEYRDLG